MSASMLPEAGHRGTNAAPTPARVTPTPRNKVVAASAGAAFGSAVGAIVAWLLQTLLTKAGLELPPEVKSAIAVVIATIVTMMAGYYTPPGANETAITGDDGKVRSALKASNEP